MEYKEIWLQCVGKFNKYEISNLGRVRTRSTRKIKSLHQDKNGYWRVTIHKSARLVHRLLADAFIPNPHKLPCVNHIDGDTSNCLLNNLEWCTYSYNNKHAYSNGLKSPYWKGKLGKDNPTSKKVYQYSLEGELLKVWDCAKQITRETGISQGNVCSVARGERNTASGFIWKFE